MEGRSSRPRSPPGIAFGLLGAQRDRVGFRRTRSAQTRRDPGREAGEPAMGGPMGENRGRDLAAPPPAAPDLPAPPPKPVADAVLDALEAEAIWALRETAAAFRNPVMLYSIGKDSGVMLHLAAKAFAPGADPVPGAARGHHVEVPRHDHVPRPDGRAVRPGPAGGHEHRRRRRGRHARSATAPRSTRG